MNHLCCFAVCLCRLFVLLVFDLFRLTTALTFSSTSFFVFLDLLRSASLAMTKWIYNVLSSLLKNRVVE